MSFLDYSQVVTGSQLDAVLRLAAVQGVGHYVHGDNALRIENATVIADIRERGWPQFGIDVPTLGACNGGAGAAAMRSLGFSAGQLLALDIEPAEFDAAPTLWPAAADAWCIAVKAAGYLAMVYGADRTVAACANQADFIWRAVPGLEDPAGPGLAPAFFAGRRAVQFAGGNLNGVEFDLSNAQFSIPGGTMADGFTQGDRDYVVRTLLFLATGEQAFQDPATGEFKPVPAEWPHWLSDQFGGLQAGQQAILAAIGKATPTVDVSALAAALQPHLQFSIDHAQLAADLAPILGADVAADLAQRLQS